MIRELNNQEIGFQEFSGRGVVKTPTSYIDKTHGLKLMITELPGKKYSITQYNLANPNYSGGEVLRIEGSFNKAKQFMKNQINLLKLLYGELE